MIRYAISYRSLLWANGLYNTIDAVASVYFVHGFFISRISRLDSTLFRVIFPLFYIGEAVVHTRLFEYFFGMFCVCWYTIMVAGLVHICTSSNVTRRSFALRLLVTCCQAITRCLFVPVLFLVIIAWTPGQQRTISELIAIVFTLLTVVSIILYAAITRLVDFNMPATQPLRAMTQYPTIMIPLQCILVGTSAATLLLFETMALRWVLTAAFGIASALTFIIPMYIHPVFAALHGFHLTALAVLVSPPLLLSNWPLIVLPALLIIIFGAQTVKFTIWHFRYRHIYTDAPTHGPAPSGLIGSHSLFYYAMARSRITRTSLGRVRERRDLLEQTGLSATPAGWGAGNLSAVLATLSRVADALQATLTETSGPMPQVMFAQFEFHVRSSPDAAVFSILKSSAFHRGRVSDLPTIMFMMCIYQAAEAIKIDDHTAFESAMQRSLHTRLRLVDTQISQAHAALHSFWDTLKREPVDLQALHDASYELQGRMSDVENTFAWLLDRSPSRPRTIALLGKFVGDLLGDRVMATRLLAYSKQLALAQTDSDSTSPGTGDSGQSIQTLAELGVSAFRRRRTSTAETSVLRRQRQHLKAAVTLCTGIMAVFFVVVNLMNSFDESLTTAHDAMSSVVARTEQCGFLAAMVCGDHVTVSVPNPQTDLINCAASLGVAVQNMLQSADSPGVRMVGAGERGRAVVPVPLMSQHIPSPEYVAVSDVDVIISIVQDYKAIGVSGRGACHTGRPDPVPVSTIVRRYMTDLNSRRRTIHMMVLIASLVATALVIAYTTAVAYLVLRRTFSRIKAALSDHLAVFLHIPRHAVTRMARASDPTLRQASEGPVPTEAVELTSSTETMSSSSAASTAPRTLGEHIIINLLEASSDSDSSPPTHTPHARVQVLLDEARAALTKFVVARDAADKWRGMSCILFGASIALIAGFVAVLARTVPMGSIQALQRDLGEFITISVDLEGAITKMGYYAQLFVQSGDPRYYSAYIHPANLNRIVRAVTDISGVDLTIDDEERVAQLFTLFYRQRAIEMAAVRLGAETSIVSDALFCEVRNFEYNRTAIADYHYWEAVAPVGQQFYTDPVTDAALTAPERRRVASTTLLAGQYLSVADELRTAFNAVRVRVIDSIVDHKADDSRAIHSRALRSILAAGGIIMACIGFGVHVIQIIAAKYSVIYHQQLTDVQAALYHADSPPEEGCLEPRSAIGHLAGMLGRIMIVGAAFSLFSVFVVLTMYTSVSYTEAYRAGAEALALQRRCLDAFQADRTSIIDTVWAFMRLAHFGDALTATNILADRNTNATVGISEATLQLTGDIESLASGRYQHYFSTYNRTMLDGIREETAGLIDQSSHIRTVAFQLAVLGHGLTSELPAMELYMYNITTEDDRLDDLVTYPERSTHMYTDTVSDASRPAEEQRAMAAGLVTDRKIANLDERAMILSDEAVHAVLALRVTMPAHISIVQCVSSAMVTMSAVIVLLSVFINRPRSRVGHHVHTKLQVPRLWSRVVRTIGKFSTVGGLLAAALLLIAGRHALYTVEPDYMGVATDMLANLYRSHAAAVMSSNAGLADVRINAQNAQNHAAAVLDGLSTVRAWQIDPTTLFSVFGFMGHGPSLTKGTSTPPIASIHLNELMTYRDLVDYTIDTFDKLTVNNCTVPPHVVSRAQEALPPLASTLWDLRDGMAEGLASRADTFHLVDVIGLTVLLFSLPLSIMVVFRGLFSFQAFHEKMLIMLLEMVPDDGRNNVMMAFSKMMLPL